MKIGSVDKIKIAIMFLVLSVFTVMMSVSFICYGVKIKDVLLFFCYNLIYIQIPGAWILHKLKVKFQSSVTKYPMAYFIGFFLLLIEYFIFMKMNMGELIKWVSPIFTLVAVVQYIYINRIHINIKDKFFSLGHRIDVFFCVFLCLIFVFAMMSLQFQYMSPEKVNYISLNQDLVWYMGNINSASQGWPLLDFRISGQIFNYHYFGDILYGVCLRIFSIPADVMTLECAPYLITYLIGFSAYSLFKEFLNKSAGIYCVLFLCSGMMLNKLVLSSGTGSWLNEHIFQNGNYVAYGLSAFMLVPIVLKYFNAAPTKKFVLIECILIMVTTGIKGPMAAVIIGGLISSELLWIHVNRRICAKRIINAIVCSVVFCVIYLVIISGVFISKHDSFGARGITVSLTDTMSLSILGKIAGDILGDAAGVYWGEVLLIVPQFLIMCLGYSLPFLYLFFKALKKVVLKRDQSVDWTMIAMIAMAITGIGGFFFLSQSGKSQGYFAFAVMPLIAVLVFHYFERNRHNTTIAKLMKGWFVVGSCIGIITFMNTFIESVRADIGCFSTMRTPVEISKEMHDGIFTADEYRAMLWLQEYADKAFLCASDRHSLLAEGTYDVKDKQNYRFFYYSGYSQCQFYLEGFGFSSLPYNQSPETLLADNEKFYTGTPQQITKACKENNVKYIVVSKFLYDMIPNLSGEHIQKCYTNDDIDIYQVDW